MSSDQGALNFKLILEITTIQVIHIDIQALLVLYAVNPVQLEPMEGDVWDFVHVKMEENVIMCLDNAGLQIDFEFWNWDSVF